MKLNRVDRLIIGVLLVILGLFVHYVYRSNYPNDVNDVAIASVYDNGISTPLTHKWDVAFKALNGNIYTCDVENIEVRSAIWESKEPGTYASFLNLETYDHHFVSNEFRAEKTILYVMTSEDEETWTMYLNQRKEAKRIATSPRSVSPPS